MKKSSKKSAGGAKAAAKNAATSAAKKLPAKAPQASTACPAQETGAAAARQKNPCSGSGLSSNKNVNEYVGDIKKMQKRWDEMGEAQRLTNLEAITNKYLQKEGLPRVGFRWADLSGGRNGEFSFTNWELVVNRNLSKSGQLSAQDAQNLADTVYHESRHAEQWFLMARKEAGAGKSAGEIRDKMSIPGNVAKEASKLPLDLETQQKKCAEALFDSVYGKNAAARNQTLKDLGPKRQALDSARQNYDKVSKDPKASKQAIGEAHKKYADAYQDFDKVYQSYRNLPEEYDAWETGGKVRSAW